MGELNVEWCSPRAAQMRSHWQTYIGALHSGPQTKFDLKGIMNHYESFYSGAQTVLNSGLTLPHYNRTRCILDGVLSCRFCRVSPDTIRHIARSIGRLGLLSRSQAAVGVYRRASIAMHPVSRRYALLISVSSKKEKEIIIFPD